MTATKRSAGWRLAAAATAGAGLVGAAVAGVGASGASADSDDRSAHVRLTGYNENFVPEGGTLPVNISTTGRGSLSLDVDDDSISYKLRYRALEGDVLQAHLHFGRPWQNGGISVWLCGTTTVPGPTGTPTCPAPGGTVRGSFVAGDVVGPTGQGIEPGNLAEFRRALRAGAVYANVHTTKYQGGEIRGQLLRHDDD